MSTPRDLLITAMEVAPDRPVEQGDLSLALAGAELCDLINTEAVTVDGDRIVPGLVPAMDDRLLDAAASSLDREAPYESVEDWLWRRGRGLYATYLAALEAEGQVTRQRNRWLPLRTGRRALADSPDRRHAAERRSSGDPVLAALEAAVGIGTEPAEDLADLVGDAVLTVLVAVNDAVMELEAVRQRRKIEDAAFDNVWRAP
ncbi:GOLPH3/VPS74 family protein [Streptomyces acidicola]|uniref:GPP34 family phosphoprotein n=1 Tax=Streptomyces acidicola TaxID=2596892 RepID=A0A5N8X5T9_9ACTN|nr:GPP34 family phosphoprotein [Streptomyces acidicola]MPY54348.1 GPP34 family phosphoprotein [Streptomyces acidicola]